MSFEMKKKLENLSKLYEVWNSLKDLDLDDADFAMAQIDQVIISITQELVELYRNENNA